LEPLSGGQAIFSLLGAKPEKIGTGEEEKKEEEAERDMVSTTSFIQSKLHHSIAASRILTRTVSVKGIYMARIQERWYHEDRIRSLNIPGYTLYSAGGTDRPRACILATNVTTWMLPGFSCRDLVAVLVKYDKDGHEDGWLLVPRICPMIRGSPRSKEFNELARYCDGENLYLVMGCDSNAIILHGGSTNCNDRGEALVEFLYFSNQGNEPTFCSGCMLEVIDITLGSFGLLESFTSWEFSSKPSLSNHRYILFALQNSVPVRLIRNPTGTNWGSS